MQWVCWGPEVGGESKAGTQKQKSAGWEGWGKGTPVLVVFTYVERNPVV